jgi:hypothetical protein
MVIAGRQILMNRKDSFLGFWSGEAPTPILFGFPIRLRRSI